MTYRLLKLQFVCYFVKLLFFFLKLAQLFLKIVKKFVIFNFFLFLCILFGTSLLELVFLQLILICVYFRLSMSRFIIYCHFFGVYLFCFRLLLELYLLLSKSSPIFFLNLLIDLSFAFGIFIFSIWTLFLFVLMIVARQHRLWFSFQKVFFFNFTDFFYILFEIFSIRFNRSVVDHSNTNDFYYERLIN